jgi:hypothetical protein
MNTFCQYLIAFMLLLSFFFNLWVDFHGRKAREPYGFIGGCSTVIITIIIVVVYWKAGAFSLIL